MDPVVRKRLKVILGGLGASQTASVTASVAAAAAPRIDPNPDPAVSLQMADMASQIAKLKADLDTLKHEDADAVVLKTVFRDKDGLITHVVETTVTPDELEQALKEPR